MSEEQFTIVGEEYVGYRQGNAYIISNGECKFSLWERKEDAQKVCDYLNEQQAAIQSLKKENEQLFEEIKRLEKMIWKTQWRFQQEVGIEKAKEHYQEIDKEMQENW